MAQNRRIIGFVAKNYIAFKAADAPPLVLVHFLCLPYGGSGTDTRPERGRSLALAYLRLICIGVFSSRHHGLKSPLLAFKTPKRSFL